MAEERVQRRLAAILAADVVGYSRLMGTDEEGTLAAVKKLRAGLIEPKASEFSGRIFKTTGDGFLAEFPSAVDAVRYSIEIQRAMAELNKTASEIRRIDLRIGISLGDVMVDGGDLFGNGVNVASRMEGLADPGGICVSGNVQEHVGHSLDISLEDLGDQPVKNIERPVRCYRVRLEQQNVSETPAPPLPDKPSIAVLPFENMSGDPEQEFFADGIAEDIITDLSKISDLFVIARNSSFTFKGRSVKVQQVGRDLGARYVLEGSVRRSGNRVRITAQLIDAISDHHLWAERYDGDLQDVFSLQDEVARKVVTTLEVTLKAGEQYRLQRRHNPELDAYDLYLRARVAWSPPLEERVLNARKMLVEVVRLDPKFAGGFAGLSFTHSLAVQHRFSSASDDELKLALELAERSVALDDSFGFSYSALSQVYFCRNDHDRAVELARRAVQMQPSDAYALGYLGFVLIYAGEIVEAVDALEQAKRLDPLHYVYLMWLTFAHFTAERFQEAIEANMRAKELGAQDVHFTLAYRAAAYCRLGRDQEARATAQELLRKYPDFSLSTWCPELFRYKRREDLHRISDALREAGIPE